MRFLVFISTAALFVSCEQKPEESPVITEVLSAESAFQETWPASRGGAGLSGRAEGAILKKPELKWSLKTEFPIASEAVITGELVIVGNDGGEVFALGLADGNEVWKKTLPEGVEGAGAIWEDLVFIPCMDGKLYALSLSDGSEEWTYETREKITAGANLAKDPAGGGDLIVFNGYDGASRCLRAATGEEIWVYETEKFINGTPALIGGDRLAFGGCDQSLYVLDLKIGKLIQEIPTEAEITSTVATDGNFMVVGNYGNQVVAAEAGAEGLKWIYTDRRFPFMSALAIGETLVYAGCRDKKVHAIDRKTGEGKWTFATGGRVESSPLLFDDGLLFGSSDGRLYGVDDELGSEIWRLDLGESLIAAPATAQGMVIVGGEKGTLFAVGEGS